MSNGSCSRTTDDDSSSSSSCFSSSSSSVSSESLYDFSELMDQLPIKRGLSMFYQGKSESFTSLSKVSSLDDLIKKKETTYTRRRTKMGSNHKKFHKYFNLPKPSIRFKKTPKKASYYSSFFPSKRVSFVWRNINTTSTPQKITSLLKKDYVSFI